MKVGKTKLKTHKSYGKLTSPPASQFSAFTTNKLL